MMSHPYFSDRLSRRSLLGGLGGAASLLPLLNARVARGEVPTFPTRLVVVTWPNGVYGPLFWPKVDPAQYATPIPLTIDPLATPAFAPLQPFAKKMLMVGGLELRNQLDSGSNNGHQAMPFVLTGVAGAPFEGTWDGLKKSAGGPSLDQHVSQALQKQAGATKFPSLVLHSGPYKGNDGFISIAGPPVANKVNAPQAEHDPAKIFQTLFADASAGGKAPTSRTDMSVLDYLTRNLDRMRTNLGGDDRDKLDAHLAGVREIERQLSTTPTAACQAPPAPKVGDYTSGGNLAQSKILGLQGDLVTAALQCDLTRVVTLNWGASTYRFAVPDGGTGQPVLDDGQGGGPFVEEHALAHKQWDTTLDGQRRSLIDRWFCQQIANLLGKFEAVKEGDGTMLDHTAVLVANQMGDGYWHAISDFPWFVAGGANGFFRTGRMLRHPSGDAKQHVPHTRLLVALCAAMGVSPNGFADPVYGPELAGLRA